jgi:hypothetical protein
MYFSDLFTMMFNTAMIAETIFFILHYTDSSDFYKYCFLYYSFYMMMFYTIDQFCRMSPSLRYLTLMVEESIVGLGPFLMVLFVVLFWFTGIFLSIDYMTEKMEGAESFTAIEG